MQILDQGGVMSGYSLAQAGARAMEHGKEARTLFWDQLKKNKKNLLIGYGAIILLASLFCLLLALAGITANVTQAKGLAIAQVVDEYSQLALRFLIVELILGIALIVLGLLALVFGWLLLSYPMLAIDIPGLYLASRQKGYREDMDVVYTFLAGNQNAFAQILLWCFVFVWLVPETMLWPGRALGLGPSASLMLTLYAVGLLASLVMWHSLRRSLEREEDAAARQRITGWLGNPSGVKDFLDIPVATAVIILIFGYLVIPAAEWTVGASHRMVAGYFVEHQDYVRMVGNFPRERLLARLDKRGKGSLKREVLPPPEKIRTFYRMELPDFRSRRDRSMVQLIPLVLILTLVMNWMCRDLHQRALKRSGP
jgi:hypothetical protein